MRNDGDDVVSDVSVPVGFPVRGEVLSQFGQAASEQKTPQVPDTTGARLGGGLGVDPDDMPKYTYF